jgi:hypothetical protein
MYKEVLSKIENISIYPLISFVVFFAFFSAIAVWVLKSRKKDFEEVSRIPLSNDND